MENVDPSTRTKDDLSIIATELDKAASALDKCRVAARQASEGRFLEAARQIRGETSAGLIEVLQAAATGIARIDFETKVRMAASRARLTYQRDLERSLDEARVQRTGTWPAYVIEDVIRLDVDLQHEIVRLAGKKIDAIEPRDVAAEARVQVERLLSRPFDRDAFLGALWDTYQEFSAEAPIGGYIDIRKVYRSVKTAMANELRDRQYSEMKFCVDLYRLLRSGPPSRNGHTLQLAPAQSSAGGLYVPGTDGGNFIAALRFIEDARSE